MLLVEQAESVFRDLLLGSGIIASEDKKLDKWIAMQPDPKVVWECCKQFSQYAVDVGSSGDDSFFFQWGRQEFAKKETPFFYIDFTRQFYLFDEDGEFKHIEQVHCMMQYKLSHDLNLPLGNLKSANFENSVAAFLDAVEETEQFYLSMERYRPFRLELYQGRV